MPEGLNDRRNLTSRHRLRGFDYQNPGYYFVTFCTHDRQNLFGEIIGGIMKHSPAGDFVCNTIGSLSDSFPNVLIDCFVVMPNHVHILIYLPLDGSEASAADIVRKVKGVCVSQYKQGVMESEWPRYDGRLWQRGFNDQIVRNDRHLDELRRYIFENPIKWEMDEMYQ